MFEVETAADRAPSEVLRMHHDRLLIARGRILDLALVDVFPNRLVAVLALRAALGRRASEDAMVELTEIGKPLVSVVELPIAHEAVTGRAAHLKQQHDRSGGVLLRSVECALGKVSNGAGGEIFAGRIVHRAFEAETNLIEVVP